MFTSLLYVSTCLAVAPPPNKPDVLPLRRLRLYETGVGYFERRGGVRPGVELTLPLPASHLDDALKSLVILEASGGTHVQGLKFASSVSEMGALALAGLSADDVDSTGYVDVLRSLEGAAVEIKHAAGRTLGVLMDVEGPFGPPSTKPGDVEPETEAHPATLEPWHALVVVDDRGAVHRLRTDAVVSVRAVDEGTQDRLRVAATAMSNSAARKSHALGVDASATGQLGLGYISEAPVWRTTYRVVLPDAGMGAELQGWALVHNDTDEDWDRVWLELANGRPQSFLYPLATPRYAYRALTGPEDELSPVPQLATRTADRMWDDGERMAYGVLGTGRGGGGRGGGGVLGFGNVGVLGKGGGPAIGDLAELSQAEGEQSGSLFIYKVQDPLDLPARNSALVPIVQQSIEAESMVWFPRGGSEARTGARIVNTTDQTLPGGVVSFFAGEGFVGESALHRLKPKERQFVAFGIEQDVELTRSVELLTKKTVALSYEGRDLTASVVSQRLHTLSLENRNERSRKVYVALDARRNAEVQSEGQGQVELDYDVDSGSALAAVDVAGGGSVVVRLRIISGKIEPVSVDDETKLAELAQQDSLPREQRDRIKASLAHRKRATAGRTELASHRARLREAEAEITRLHADLEALGRGFVRGRVARAMAKQLLQTERRIDQLRDQIELARAIVKRERRLAKRELSSSAFRKRR